ncbi:MAG: hybrid sensor histidine kinase/response regulator [Planctomycetales bacterium]|nr:hybrid sensor histidine kinase/response regulator [Planctomycetales bacterium]
MSDHGAIRILLLEDDLDDYELFVKHLRRTEQHFVVDHVPAMQDALQALQVKQYDAVLADLNVPDSNGHDTIKRLKCECNTIPIIAITGVDDPDVARNILSVGAQDYIVKAELSCRSVSRIIVHAVHRQRAVNEIADLVGELEKRENLLQDQALLLRRKNEKLNSLYRTAQELVDNVSHDLRTPLTVIKDFVGILSEEILGPVNEKQKSLLDRINIRTDDLAIMVDDLLDVSKLGAGLLGAWRRATSVAEVVDGILPMLEQRSSTRKIDFRIDIPSSLPKAFCDAEKLSRVITNLCVNAIKFTPEGGDVCLWATHDPVEHGITVGITDTGDGMDVASLNRIFERFQQLERSSIDSTKGFGLGLNIAQQLSRLNLGELAVESEVGKGSTFSFSVPCQEYHEVFRRWLHYLPKTFECVHFIRIEIAECTAKEIEEFDFFLSCMLRRDDLLLQPVPGAWLFALDIPKSEFQRWEERLSKKFTEANRNRPLGPLPDYFVSAVFRSDDTQSHEEIIEAFDFALQRCARSRTELVGAVE